MLTALGVFLFTLVLVVWRPRGLGIGWGALLGAGLGLALGVIHWQDISAVWDIVWDPTFTFVALIVISLLFDEAGFFHWAALHIARRGRGNGPRLFVLVILLGALVSAFFANDGTALILTPIVLAVLLALGFSAEIAFAFVIACGFVADTTSLPLVISNLVNILSADYFRIPFDRYALVMVPVDAAALVATLVVLWLYFRRRLPKAYALAAVAEPKTAVRDPLVFRLALPLLALLLIAYLVTARFHVPVSFVTGAAALALLFVATRAWRRGDGRLIPVAKVLREAPWQIVLFSLGMYLVVYGLRDAGLTAYLAKAFVWLGEQPLFVTTVGTGFISGGLSAVLNNMPMVMIGALSIHQAQALAPAARQAMIYANVVGCDLGPKFTPIGSLATLLWLHVLARKGEHIGWRTYMRIGIVLTPPVLFTTLAALTGWLAFLR